MLETDMTLTNMLKVHFLKRVISFTCVEEMYVFLQTVRLTKEVQVFQPSV